MSPIPRRAFLGTTVTLGAVAWLGPRATAFAAGFELRPALPLIPAPEDPADWPAFRQQLAAWRDATRRQLAYRDALYRRPEFDWVPSCFSCGFLMMCDETFYDPAAGRYRVAEYLDHGRREFGGCDAIVLWHAYPRIGVDDRNQFDFYRDMPGGIVGLQGVVAGAHERGVKVFIDYNPWDTGTRREGKSDLDVLATLVQALNVDGIFLDTMDRGAEAFRGKLDAVRPGVVLEGEIALPLERVHDHHLSWAQGFNDGEVPGVLRNKWFERRHLQHQIKRWDFDHTGELQTAWMNGSGVMVWENVFGSWIGWSPRDRSILRAMLPIQRRFASLFAGEGWTPLVPTLMKDVYASLWEQGRAGVPPATEALAVAGPQPGAGEPRKDSGCTPALPSTVRLWTLVNRSTRGISGGLLSAEPQPGERFFDLVSGAELKPGRGGGGVMLTGTMPPRGIGCFLAAQPAALNDRFDEFLAGQKAIAERADWNSIPQTLRTNVKRVAPTRRSKRAPKGWVELPAAEVVLKTKFRVRECGYYEAPTDLTPALHATRAFERPVRIERFAMDATPVTNARFAEFLRRSNYRPRDPENFLKHWGHGHPPAGKEDHPVVYVALEDARAYAAWAGKRLPAEEEWQYAAQGPAALRYPWGNERLPGRCNGGETGDTTPVQAFPAGRSPFGVYDLCGNVWEWTESERTDGRTRFSILKGGSFYQAKGSDWYFDGGPQTNQHSAKFLLMWPGLDRCATIGFRCVVDLVGRRSRA